jgi:hypothetical protein
MGCGLAWEIIASGASVGGELGGFQYSPLVAHEVASTASRVSARIFRTGRFIITAAQRLIPLFSAMLK